MTLSIIIALIIIGLLLLVLEILVIPGAGFAGIIGFIMIAVGIFYAYSEHGALTGHIILAASFVLSVAGAYFSIRSKTWKNAMLDTKLKGKAPSPVSQKLQKGDTGVAISRLAPIGTAIFGDTKCEVQTLGEYVDPGTEVEIFKIDLNKIFVKAVQLN